jgi:hypothetical protein
MWIRPDNSYPVGPVNQGTQGQLQNWSEVDNQPYSSGSWWYSGNFLLDGHNNGGFQNGTFSLQFYGGGRLRWLFGDGIFAGNGGHWAVQAYPASTTASLLDGQWHHISCVRRWDGGSGSILELWIDGELIATENSPARTNMATTYWNSWSGFPGGQEGWFYGAEKQAAIGILSQYEDYKGLVDEMYFWDRAKTTQELQNDWDSGVTGSETGLVGWYDFNEGSGSAICKNGGGNCIALFRTSLSNWDAEDAPIGNAPNPDYIYVDFDAPTGGNGTQEFPYASLLVGVLNANSGGTIELAPASAPQTLSIHKPLTLINGNPGGGPVVVGGAQGSVAGTTKNQTGFVAGASD